MSGLELPILVSPYSWSWPAGAAGGRNRRQPTRRDPKPPVVTIHFKSSGQRFCAHSKSVQCRHDGLYGDQPNARSVNQAGCAAAGNVKADIFRRYT